MKVGDVLLRNANRFPRKTAVVSEGLTEGYKQLNERVNRLSNWLIAKGLEKGERIGVLVHNGHEFIEIYFAAAKTGNIFCPYNNHLKRQELLEILNYSQPSILFFDQDYADLIDSLRTDITPVRLYVSIQKGLRQSFSESYEAILSSGNITEPNIIIQEDDVVSMFFTAGTTGRPKGALHTHRHVVLNALTGVIELKVDYDDKVMITFPMYHVAGEDNIMRHSYMPNTIFARREGNFNSVEVLEFIQNNGITRCQLVPTMIHSLLQVPDLTRFNLNSLRLIIYTGAPMPVELLKKALRAFPCSFAQLYGQTESGPLTTILKPEDHDLGTTDGPLNRLASSGRPVLSYEIKVIGKNGSEAEPGEVGEIILRSEAMMTGYWRMPDETTQKIKDGWLYTGDLGKVDQDGFVYIVERKNDMIISGGVNIYPREIEEVLYKHDAVLEASVLGVPDEHWGETVKAIIVLKDSAIVNADEIINFCGDHLASYKKPRSVEFWKELPKSPQGKILKRVIRESCKGDI
ncbi:MAG: long-chain-fatty-acid--CoA ligase [Desulfobacteraceae bacterium]|nr:MAG: long-chain-fatty-acid--CoA ligase [Desulfobacteraceae bacterium]